MRIDRNNVKVFLPLSYTIYVFVLSATVVPYPLLPPRHPRANGNFPIFATLLQPPKLMPRYARSVLRSILLL